MKEFTIPKITFRNALLAIVILAVPLSGFWITQLCQVYREDVCANETQYMEHQKELVGRPVPSTQVAFPYTKDLKGSTRLRIVFSRILWWLPARWLASQPHL